MMKTRDPVAGRFAGLTLLHPPLFSASHRVATSRQYSCRSPGTNQLSEYCSHSPYFHGRCITERQAHDLKLTQFENELWIIFCAPFDTHFREAQLRDL